MRCGSRAFGHFKFELVVGLILAMTGLVEVVFAFSAQQSEGPQKLQNAYQFIESTRSGQALLKRVGKDVRRSIQFGKVSKTDSVLVRHLDVRTGKEVVEKEISVTIQEDQPFVGVVLDLTHELVHAVNGAVWDPYNPKLTERDYVLTTIDGPGGEVDAMTVECEVNVELNKKYGFDVTKCEPYLSKETGKVDRNRIRKDFYRVGQDGMAELQDLVPALSSDDLPHLSEEAPKFISSTGKAPYPVALVREFIGMNRIACENSRKRLGAIRLPASHSAIQSAREAAKRFISLRCQNTRKRQDAVTRYISQSQELE